MSPVVVVQAPPISEERLREGLVTYERVMRLTFWSNALAAALVGTLAALVMLLRGCN